MKTVLFDVDGVLADFVWGFTRAAGVEPWGHETQPYWNFEEDRLPVKVQKETWKKIVSIPFWWAELPILKSVSISIFDRINALRAGNNIIFGTNRIGNPSAQFQTQRWLSDHGIFNPAVVITKYKGELAKVIGADYAIDDKAENAALIKWLTDDLNKPCHSYIIDRPYNRMTFLSSKIRRVSCVEEFLEDVERGK